LIGVFSLMVLEYVEKVPNMIEVVDVLCRRGPRTPR
jgi:hypothetical protein